jgi:predicted nucleic acid-binding protein
VNGGRRRPDEGHEDRRRGRTHALAEVLVVDYEVTRHYAEIVADLRAAGTPLPTNDIWIAATAARSGALVLTYDRHFEAMARVGSVVLSR